MHSNTSDKLIILGDIILYKNEMSYQSKCFQNNWKFDYHGIDNVLCGKTLGNMKSFDPRKIVVIQME